MEKDLSQAEAEKRGRGFSWYVLLLAAVVVYSVWTLAGQQMTLGELNDDMAAAQERLQKARTENQQLNEEHDLLYDDAYIEKLAREELGMTRRDEMPYIYADNK